METIVQGRKVIVSTKGRLHGFKWEWNGKAVDVATGTSVESKNWKAQGGASDHAIQDLFTKLAPILEEERALKQEQEKLEKKAIADASRDLPPGWTAQYDPVKKKAFYDNHVFKVTQWEKPIRVDEKVDDEEKEVIVVPPKPDTKSRTYFISYKQSESEGLALNLWTGLGGNNTPGAWLDVKNPSGQTVADMMAGVRECKYFILILTKGYFDSTYCRDEFNEAVALGKEAIMLFNTDKIAKSSIGDELEKAKTFGIELGDWPSALPISTDVNLFAPMLAALLRTTPKKLVKK